MLKILAKKASVLEIYVGHDIENFNKENLKKYDAIILNNSNSESPRRDLFWDLLKMNSFLTDEEIAEKAIIYEKNLMDY